MKRYLLSLYIICVYGLVVLAQPRILFNKEKHDFGQVLWKSPVTVEFVITNTGNKPLVLSNVTVSCACAIVDWTKTPIAPGSKGTVSATFDAKALGHFHKAIGIYSNATPSLVYLHFVGEVVRKVTDFSNLDLHAVGQIMIDKTEIDFPDVHRGERPTIQLSIVNQSSKPYEPILMHLPPYLSMTKEPSVLQKGEKGEITLTLNTERLPDLGLTQTSVYLSRFAGDKVNEENEIPVSVVLLPDFSGLGETEIMNAPIIRLSRTSIDVGNDLSLKDKVTYDITISNAGRSVLRINKLQVFHPAVGVSLKKTILQSAESTHLKVTLNKKNLKKKRQLRILLISNDPVNPKATIHLRLQD